MNNYPDILDDSLNDPQGELSAIKRFFFSCAGSYTKILEITPSEHNKYVGIGATIFLTACLAVISGTFAINTIVDNFAISIFFGLLWGALIFNLDRYIVSSIRKEGKFWNEFGLAVPRLVLAMLISVVITKPIEAELFRNQIDSELVAYTADLEKSAEMNLNEKLGIDSLRSSVERIDSLRRNYKREKEGKPTSFNFGEVSVEYDQAKTEFDKISARNRPIIAANTKKRGYLWDTHAKKVFKEDENGNQVFDRWNFPDPYQSQSTELYKINKQLKKQIAEKEAVVVELETKRLAFQQEFSSGIEEEIAFLKKKREDLMLTLEERENRKRTELPLVLEKAKKYGVGFPAKIQALERLKDDSSSIWWISNMIVLLFMLIETSPVFVKLISKRGPYDYILNRVEHQKKVRSLKLISDMNEDLNASVRRQARRNQQRYAEEVLATDDF